MSTILYFKHEDVMTPKPWPVAIDGNGFVLSGLGSDDGSKLVGFGPKGAFTVTVIRKDMTPENVVGLVPTFSDGNGFFEWALEVQEVVVR
jgi:hypothetical protein